MTQGTIPARNGSRVAFTHQDVARMTQAYHAAGGGTPGREAVYKAFTHVQNGKLDEKMIELGIMERPVKITLGETDRTNIVAKVVDMVTSSIPEEHHAEAARAITAGLRDTFAPKRSAKP